MSNVANKRNAIRICENRSWVFRTAFSPRIEIDVPMPRRQNLHRITTAKQTWSHTVMIPNPHTTCEDDAVAPAYSENAKRCFNRTPRQPLICT